MAEKGKTFSKLPLVVALMSSEESVSLDHISSEYCRVFLAFNPHPPPHRAEKRHIWLRKNSDQATGLTGISPLC